MAKKIILINLNQKAIYETVKIRVAAIYSPVLSLAMLGAACLKNGHMVRIFDMNLPENDEAELLSQLDIFRPDFVGITFTTPLFPKMKKIAALVKKHKKECILLGGGAHASSFPDQTIKDSPLDLVVVGEGDFALPEIISGKNWEKINGVCFKKEKKIIRTAPRDYIKDLDVLPFPAWHLYDIAKYKSPAVLTRANPTGWLETSRGCVYGCVYCNKSVFGRTFRTKSAERVADEMGYTLNCGFKEIHIADDCMTTNMDRAEKICDLIIKRKLKFPWATVTGIRVDRVSLRLLRKMKKAGCYRVYFGIESGSQRILDGIKKGTNINQIKNAVKWAKMAGLETFGAFMIALPGEEIEDVKKTIKFATSLDLDVAKMSVTTPLPATPLFNDLEAKGMIKTKDWGKFNLYIPSCEVYDHPNLDWKTVDKYYSQFYRKFYFSPKFLIKRFKQAIKHKTLLSDIKNALGTKW